MAAAPVELRTSTGDRPLETSAPEDSLQGLEQRVQIPAGPEDPAGSVGVNPLAIPSLNEHPPAELPEDFIRNFLIKRNLARTLKEFEAEWYEQAAARPPDALEAVPDVYAANSMLEQRVERLESQLAQAQKIADNASGSWDKFRKERDFHRLHHRRVLQEKNRLVTDIRRLKQHYSLYEPVIEELRRKHEHITKEKMLVNLKNDRLDTRVAELQTAAAQQAAQSSARRSMRFTIPPAAMQQAVAKSGARSSTGPAGIPALGVPPPDPMKSALAEAMAMAGTRRDSKPQRPLPVSRPMPEPKASLPSPDPSTFKEQATIRAHSMPISYLAVHPSKPIVVSTSDDKSWKMWHLPKGDLIMSGEGHQDWVAGADVNPKGSFLATGSGDSTVKIWSFEQQKCVATYSDHSLAVWSVAWHDSGDFVASCSLDHTARLWDVTTRKCRQTFRGHVDSVNHVCWQPGTNVMCTASTDKTLSLWDPRSGLCSHTFYGHSNSCSSADFSPQGTSLASVDADGNLKVWDIRQVAETLSTEVSDLPCSACSFDSSGGLVAAACDSGRVVCVSATTGAVVGTLGAATAPMQAAAILRIADAVVTGGNDGNLRLWSAK
ncbi:hypothetical protein WJX84_003984 [Apatococcus fuscideae]|uniref:Uncharacterized protein n=1 Tax=Apatococcus fuscideae TaxID=2026836 RepID=A0AAW1T2V5_9CHLO